MAFNWSPRSTSSGSKNNNATRRSSSASRASNTAGTSSRAQTPKTGTTNKAGSARSSRTAGSATRLNTAAGGTSQPRRSTTASNRSLSGRQRQQNKTSDNQVYSIGPNSTTRKTSSARNASRPARQETNRASRRMRDVRAGQARAQRMQRFGGLIKAGIATVIVVVALLIAFACIYHSSLFSVEQVVVEGEHFLTSEQVVAMAQTNNTTLLRVDKADIASRLSSSVWVDSVQVSRDFPHALVIDITERLPVAVTQSPVTTEQTDTIDWLMAADGRWLAPINYEASDEYGYKLVEAAAGLPYITGVSPEVSAVEDSMCQDEGVANALAVLAALSPDLGNQVVRIYAPTVEQTQLVLANNITVDFGSVAEASDKERIALQVMAENPGGVAYINVRVPSHVVWRGIELAPEEAL